MKLKFLKLLYIFFLILNIFVFVGAVSVTQAVCPDNVVVDPLDPDCVRSATTFGGLANRFIKIIPFIITILGVVGVARGALKIMRADSDDDKKEGFKGVINTAIGAGLFYSIWMVLYLVEQFTGADIIRIG